VFHSQGEYSKALGWYQRALDDREKTLGKDRPQTLNTVNNTASVFNNQESRRVSSKALIWHQRALDGREKALGKGHPDTRTSARIVGTLSGVAPGYGGRAGLGLWGRERWLRMSWMLNIVSTRANRSNPFDCAWRQGFLRVHSRRFFRMFGLSPNVLFVFTACFDASSLNSWMVVVCMLSIRSEVFQEQLCSDFVSVSVGNVRYW